MKLLKVDCFIGLTDCKDLQTESSRNSREKKSRNLEKEDIKKGNGVLGILPFKVIRRQDVESEDSESFR